MNCQTCNEPFNPTTNTPLLLPKCGHTICQHCLTKNFHSGKLTCPQCKIPSYAELITDFPKNKILIEQSISQNTTINNITLTEKNQFINENSYIDSSLLKELNTKTIYSKKSGRYFSCNEIENKCTLHRKTVEAFCIDCGLLLCVSCLLEKTHNGHNIYNIEEGFEMAVNRVSSRLDDFSVKNKFLFENYENCLKNVLNEISQQQDISLTKLDIQYNELIDLILRRKKEAMSRVRLSNKQWFFQNRKKSFKFKK